jgi:hypothetical protein
VERNASSLLLYKEAAQHKAVRAGAKKRTNGAGGRMDDSSAEIEGGIHDNGHAGKFIDEAIVKQNLIMCAAWRSPTPDAFLPRQFQHTIELLLGSDPRSSK